MRKKYIAFLILLICVFQLAGCADKTDTEKERVKALYGVNEEITADYDGSLAVKCNNGTFVGKEENGVLSFKGIPYAVQPIGEHRWKRVPVAPDGDGVYEAYYFGKSPIQTEASSERASYYERGEDCLYLNIWNNRRDENDKKPVMVFIHGGSYGWGGTSDPLYDGQNFASAHEDVILVTIGYRTGMMGFIDLSSFPDGDEYSESGNLGLLDQITALQWIQKNIAAFGGDPENVTIFGESAGGGSVSLLPLIPEAEGLFHRIIAESGSIGLTFSREECEGLTQRLIDETGAQSVAELLELDEDEIKEINISLNDYNNFPERDGIILPEDLYTLYESGAAKDIDMLIGTNADEARYWLNEVGVTKYKIGIPVLFDNNMKRVSDEDRELVDKAFSIMNMKRIWKITEFYNETMFRLPAIAMAEGHSANGGNTYMYYWKYPSAIKDRGACHAVELAYVFNNLDETLYTGDNIDPHLAAAVQQMWVNFAKTGDPRTEDISWDQYDTDTRSTMILDSDCHMEDDPLSEQRELLMPLNKYRFNGSYVNLSLNVPTVYKYIGIVIGVIAGLACISWLILKKLKMR